MAKKENKQCVEKRISSNSLEEKATILATICQNLTYCIKHNKRVAFILDRNMETAGSLRVPPAVGNSDLYTLIDLRLNGIPQDNVLGRIIELKYMIDGRNRFQINTIDQERIIDFCYLLAFVDYNFCLVERSRDDETDFVVLRAMDELRRTINRFFRQHCFLIKPFSRPLLGVMIDQCQVLKETDQETMLCLTRSGAEKYANTLRKMIYSRAKVISDDYTPVKIDTSPIVLLAQNLCRGTDEEIDAMETVMNAKRREAEQLDFLFKRRVTQTVKNAVVSILEVVTQVGIDVGPLILSGGVSAGYLGIEALKAIKKAVFDNRKAGEDSLKEKGEDSGVVSQAFDCLDLLLKSQELYREVEFCCSALAVLREKKDYTMNFLRMMRLYNDLAEEMNDNEGEQVSDFLITETRCAGNQLVDYCVRGLQQHSAAVAAVVKKGRELFEQGFRHMNGVPQNRDQAIEAWRKAADLGNADAMYELGRTLGDTSSCLTQDRGEAFEKVQKEAFNLVQRAADLGNVKAMMHLGTLFEDGNDQKGVQKDLEKACVLYQRAAQGGFTEARNRYEECVRKIPTTDTPSWWNQIALAFRLLLLFPSFLFSDT